MLLSNLSIEQYKTLTTDTDYWNGKICGIMMKEQLPIGEIMRFSYGSNIVYSYENKYVIKLFASFYRDEYVRELEVLNRLFNSISLVEVPQIVRTGQYEGWDYIIMTELKGTLLIDIWDELSFEEKTLLSQDLGKTIKEFHRVPVENFQNIDVDWNDFIRKQLHNFHRHHEGLKETLYEDLNGYIEEKYINFSPQLRLLTGEYTPFNLLMNKVEGIWRLSGVIDFADCFLGDGDYDLLGPILFIFKGNKQLIRECLQSYGFQENAINDFLIKKLMTYTILHRFSNIPYYISQIEEAQQVTNFDELANILFDMK